MAEKGSLSTPDNPGNSKLMLWVRDVALKYEGDDCLIWPFARDPSGYGSFGRQRRKMYAHRYICELVNGPPDCPKDHAAHSCNNGPGGCVTRKHLSWKTNAENQIDRWRDGPKKHRFKLTPEQAAEIRALKGYERSAITARRFGVGEAHVRQIQSGRTRPTNKPALRQFSDIEVQAIRQESGSATTIAAKYGASVGSIRNIRSGRSYVHVPPPHNIHQRQSGETS